MRLLTVLIGILLFGCVERFNPELNQSGDGLIFVTGVITDKQRAAVKIGMTTLLEGFESDVNYISTARVELVDDLGATETLFESDGTYFGTSPGTLGRSYHIEIVLASGEIITSEPELLSVSADVGVLSLEKSKRTVYGYSGEPEEVDGLNVNILIDQEELLSKYYLWTWSGTYQVTTELTQTVCYAEENIITYFALGESQSTTRDLFKNTIRFAQAGRKYSEGYFAEITQFSISPKTYAYWKQIKDQQENVGSIFDSPPAIISGNLSSSSDNSILGYFQVSSENSKMIFIDPDDFSEKPVANNIACYPSRPTAIPPLWCSSCEGFSNGSQTKPSFWPF